MFLLELLASKDPDSILSLCNGRLHTIVTRVWPNPSLDPVIISKYDSVDHLLDSVAASCFIPLYSARRSTTEIRSMSSLYNQRSHYVDGGMTAFMPPVGDIRISPLPMRLFPPLLLRRKPHISLVDYAINTCIHIMILFRICQTILSIN